MLFSALVPENCLCLYIRIVYVTCLQHANEDVEKIIVGNKCDMDDRRQVPTARGEAVSYLSTFISYYCLHKVLHVYHIASHMYNWDIFHGGGDCYDASLSPVMVDIYIILKCGSVIFYI